ncbi:MAG: 2OG-Fe(II) oxygenase [Alphaproteobacteria bacterium]|nr:2OG-Fe(II) oxygenase [Alphaproteobacteria bacterium]
MLDIAAFRHAPLKTKPYDYLVLPGFIRPEWQERMLACYPEVKQGGSFPLSTVPHSDEFHSLIDALNGDEFRKAVEEKFSLDLSGRPTTFTVRGRCRKRDGKVHTDSVSKIITVLLYMNPAWENGGGRLRVLNSENLEDYAEEIPPMVGSLLVFRRADNSFHGHHSFDGKRQVIQMNWVTDQDKADYAITRHSWTSVLKKMGLAS